ncbi:hypothetical protein GOP47_0029556 [Adiantum capillus-veneris]|nr:hypothetical protein GOP47_0029556 [Adiantum capillus-veneris]
MPLATTPFICTWGDLQIHRNAHKISALSFSAVHQVPCWLRDCTVAILHRISRMMQACSRLSFSTIVWCSSESHTDPIKRGPLRCFERRHPKHTAHQKHFVIWYSLWDHMEFTWSSPLKGIAWHSPVV